MIKLIYNDLDVYHGNFGDGILQRRDCTWAKLNGIEKEVNFISCSNLNINYFIQNCDINVVAVFVFVGVSEKKVSTVKWTVGDQF